MKWSELPKHIYTLISDSQELDCILAYLGIVEFADEVTAALVAVKDGDYEAVYLTEGGNFKHSAHWDWYTPDYFADSIPEELDLQDVRDNRDHDDDYGV